MDDVSALLGLFEGVFTDFDKAFDNPFEGVYVVVMDNKPHSDEAVDEFVYFNAVICLNGAHCGAKVVNFGETGRWVKGNAEPAGGSLIWA